MEKVWEELKKIEAQAEQIRSEAQDKAKNMAVFAQKEAEELLTNSKTYAEMESQQLFQNTTDEANRNREELLKANQAAVDKLKLQAEKHMDTAISRVLDVVIKEVKT